MLSQSQPKKKVAKVNRSKSDIKNVLERRKISNLIHFTSLENLNSILKYGLSPVTAHTDNGIKSKVTDTNRYEFEKTFTNFTVDFPNYKMFYSKRMQIDTIWVVLVLDTDVLLEDGHQLKFCAHNAAYREIRYQLHGDMSSGSDFEAMFSERINYYGKTYIRNIMGLPSYYTVIAHPVCPCLAQ